MPRLQVIVLLFVPVLLAPLQAQALQDPTRPPGRAVSQEPVREAKVYDLASILFGPDRRVAVIDGVPRREGESFDGARVQRIHPDRVELVVQGQLRLLRLAAPPRVRSSQ
ncbi:MSHA biogenesis protein MshK [Marinobacter daqiaonensis]|uniref:MSHA biogenesis protein MshK n=1 Tax=Marinobacter daqiaonensis TaxID=650891 RepID=A0A1I6K191_9GAMM|nr:hypothetical protein [Marinobacter daqiaonensis]SFR84947.1 MSHA biogenesis protein MshK [Marinobacter daqiaonensis]